MDLYNRNSLLTRFILALWAIVVLIPILIVVFVAVKAPSELAQGPLSMPASLEWANFAAAWNQGAMSSSLMNSIAIAGTSVITIILLSSAAAYPLSRRKKKWATVTYLYFLSGMMIPFQMTMIPLYKLLGQLNLIGKYPGPIFIYIALGLPFSIFLYTAFFKSIPQEIEESALIDGCGPYRTFWSILFPLLKPVTSTLLIMNTLTIWNDFFVPLLFLQSKQARTIPLSIYSFTGEFVNQWNLIFAAVIIGSLPLILLFLVLQKQFIQGMASGAVKG
ncbi:carbohydrate ABC transporter permease [Paenibacillus hamazuiensis]|uniref:carbohydrate ABC transporter permease n=1 Tax=Paenibacillus hamazuiensis TaxID=2936508 RepID=UPI00200F8AA4|nr:carbohydrate ABC transporter permease [Paenibacillus hamazuiensis]